MEQRHLKNTAKNFHTTSEVIISIFFMVACPVTCCISSYSKLNCKCFSQISLLKINSYIPRYYSKHYISNQRPNKLHKCWYILNTIVQQIHYMYGDRKVILKNINFKCNLNTCISDLSCTAWEKKHKCTDRP